MFCAISGSVPEHPVVSRKSGHLFEKRLILKVVQDSGKCPVTGEELAEDDLVELKSNAAVKPRPSPATSIPGLLSLLHNEWDALMLETNTLRQNLNTVRQELSHALYQHDAACRVIARLLKERDEARSALQNLQQAVPAEMANGKRAPEEEPEEAPAKRPRAGITAEVLEVLSATSLALSKGRKQRQISPTIATVEELENYGLLANQPLHKTTQGGILAIDLSEGDENVVASAGADSTVVMFDRAAGRIVDTLNGHTKKVTDVKFFAPGVVLTTSGDRTCRMWQSSEGNKYQCVRTFEEHTAEVVSVSVHPSKKYFVTASADKTWCFYDGEMCLSQVVDPGVEGGYVSAAFHPDGIILGTGTDEKLVRIWDVKQQKNVAKFEGHTAPVTSLSFSENGYFLATCASDGIKLWDLRKLKNFKTLTPYSSSPTTYVSFDHSGLFLAASGADARIYAVKQDWSVVKTFEDMPKKGALSVRFGADAKQLYVGATDHNLRIYGTPTE